MSEAERFAAPIGTRDVLPPESGRWARLIGEFVARAQGAGYGLLQGPMFEDLGVFLRMGEATDVVTKEMYDFEDKAGRRLALRPEGTAGAIRAFVEHRPQVPWKVWYAAPNFRYEKPQKGRYRQHHQLGAEAVGAADPDVDVELITLLWDFYRGLGLRRIDLRLNSIGDAEARAVYRDTLQAWLAGRVDALHPDDRAKVATNPLRVLDSKHRDTRQATEGAPLMLDSMNPASVSHFERVQAGLAAAGIPCTVDPRLVRGLDYYTHTVFEVVSDAIDASQSTIGGGGRYDGLVEQLGGPPTPAVGFGSGIERTLFACDAEGVFTDGLPPLDAFVVDLVDGTAGRDITTQLRRAGLRADRAFDGRSAKSQMKAADRSGARFALLVGADEADTSSVTVRDLRQGGDQEAVERTALVEHLAKRLDRLPPPH